MSGRVRLAERLDNGRNQREAEEFVSRLKALAVESRLRLISYAHSACEHGVTVGELVDQLDIKSPTVSHHLSILREAGLLGSSRRSYYVYNQPDLEAFEDLADDLRSLIE